MTRSERAAAIPAPSQHHKSSSNNNRAVKRTTKAVRRSIDRYSALSVYTTKKTITVSQPSIHILYICSVQAQYATACDTTHQSCISFIVNNRFSPPPMPPLPRRKRTNVATKPNPASVNHVSAYIACLSGVVLCCKYALSERRCSIGDGEGDTRSITSGDSVGNCSRDAMSDASREMYAPAFAASYVLMKMGVCAKWKRADNREKQRVQ